MLIPLRTDRHLRRRPRVTGGLILTNLVVYLFVLAAGVFGSGPERIIDAGVLASGERFNPFALITYQFLHDPSSIFHLLFNMVFLWVFGSAVEDRMGHRLFLLFYLCGGICAGLAHMLVSPGVGVIGASGATAAVTGAFLALYPRGRVLVLFVFILIGIHAIRAPWLVAIYFGIDLISQASELFGGARRGVAYAAHLAGYAFGLLVPLALLRLKILRTDPEDGLALLRQWQRRRAFHRLAKQGSGRVWEPRPADAEAPSEPAKPATPTAEEDPEAAASARRRRLETARERITGALAAGRTIDAAHAWRDAHRESSDFALPPALQQELASTLCAAGHDDEAKSACECFLSAYGKHERADEVRLLLAMLEGRRFGKREAAGSIAREVAERRRGEELGTLAEALAREFAPG